jgi:Fe2+ or Zn2+ uptake regulation protein
MGDPGRTGARQADFSRQIRHAGLRATRPRLLVLELFAELGGHHSADEVAARLVARATPLPRTSVYNVVNALAAHGLLTVTDVGPGRALYELAERWHHHFVCRQCGRIIDVPCLAAAKPCLRPRRGELGEIDEAQIIFRGRCRACLDGRGRRPKARRGGRAEGRG